MAGALDAFNDPATQGLLSLSASLLQAGGPSATPVPTGAAMGNAYQGYQADRQRQALLGLEQQKGALTAMQVNAAMRQQAFQEWALTGKMPDFSSMSAPGGLGTQQAPQQPMPFNAPQPMPSGAPMAPQGAPQGPQGLPPGSPLASLPPDAQQAIRLNMALPGAGPIAMQATQPVIGREGGIYKRNQDGSMSLDPGWIKGEEERLRLQEGIKNQNTIVDVPLADGRVQKMTKAQQLQVVDATAPINGLPKEVVGDIQRQLLAEPTQPVDVNITLNGRSTKLTIPALGGGLPGVTAGQSTEARSAAEKSGMNAGDVQNDINQEAASALQSRKILGEMRGLSQDFNQGKIAPFKRALGEWAQATGIKGFEEEIKSAESQQALQKLTAQMATAAMKQFTNRGTQMEFKTFLQNNPNAELTPGGFQKVLEFMDKSAQASLDKQQAYQGWRQQGNPVERSQDFLAEWNKKQNEGLGEPAKQFPAPPQPAINRLKMNPKEKDQFDAIFGPGSAARALGR